MNTTKIANTATFVKRSIIKDLNNKGMTLVRFIESKSGNIAGVGRFRNGVFGLSAWVEFYDRTDEFEMNYERSQNEIWANNCPYPTDDFPAEFWAK